MPLIIQCPEISRDGSDTRVSLPISDHDPVEFLIRGNPDLEFTPTQLGNLSLSTSLLPAMRLGETLKIEAPVSGRLLDNARTLTQIFHRWFRDPAFEMVDILADPSPDGDGNSDGGCACFFSGGVDSLHSVQQHRAQLTELVFVHGFDIPSGDTGQAQLVRNHLSAAAGAIGLPLTEVWTDLRGFSDRYCYWGHHYFGAALAAIGHLLSPTVGRIYIPGSCAYDMLEPWGSHVLSDPLWSGGGLQVIHDGASSTRMDKVASIAGWEIAQKHLRVCWEGPPGSYNCGSCEKCTRTQAALRATGEIGQFSVFDSPLDLENLASQRRPHPAYVPMIVDMLDFALAKNTDPQLIGALERSARGSQAEISLKRFAKNNTDVLATENWQRLLPKVRNKLFRSLSQSDPDWFVGRLDKILPAQRDAILSLLHRKDPKWLAKAARALKRKK